MTTTTSPTRPLAPMPGCHACNGTGIDTAFGTECTECLHDAENADLLRARFNAPTGPNDRIHHPGERMDGRTFGRTADSIHATASQVSYLSSLLRARPADCAVRIAFAQTDLQALSRNAASAAIDSLKALEAHETVTTPARPAHRSNQYPGTCPECHAEVPAGAGSLAKENGHWVTRHVGECPVSEATPVVGLDLSPLKQYTSSGRAHFGVPAGDTRLKVRVKFARNGTVYVDDGAAYGEGRNYGRQAPGAAYRGDITDELTAIVADPLGALKRYAEITSHCGICNRPLEDAVSVERGIGPVCWAKVS